EHEDHVRSGVPSERDPPLHGSADHDQSTGISTDNKPWSGQPAAVGPSAEPPPRPGPTAGPASGPGPTVDQPFAPGPTGGRALGPGAAAGRASSLGPTAERAPWLGPTAVGAGETGRPAVASSARPGADGTRIGASALPGADRLRVGTSAGPHADRPGVGSPPMVGSPHMVGAPPTVAPHPAQLEPWRPTPAARLLHSIASPLQRMAREVAGRWHLRTIATPSPSRLTSGRSVGDAAPAGPVRTPRVSEASRAVTVAGEPPRVIGRPSTGRLAPPLPPPVDDDPVRAEPVHPSAGQPVEMASAATAESPLRTETGTHRVADPTGRDPGPALAGDQAESNPGTSFPSEVVAREAALFEATGPPR